MFSQASLCAILQGVYTRHTHPVTHSSSCHTHPVTYPACHTPIHLFATQSFCDNPSPPYTSPLRNTLPKAEAAPVQVWKLKMTKFTTEFKFSQFHELLFEKKGKPNQISLNIYFQYMLFLFL